MVLGKEEVAMFLGENLKTTGGGALYCIAFLPCIFIKVFPKVQRDWPEHPKGLLALLFPLVYSFLTPTGRDPVA